MVDTKVLIGVPTAEFARRADFYDYLNFLMKPAGSELVTTHGQSPARGRNVIIEHALNNGHTHVMFIDDDTIFQPNLLMNLLNHNVDIVTGLYLMRNYPHQPIIFDVALDDGRCGYHYLNDKETGLIEVVNCGLGACLIKTHVFKAMEKPWVTLGQLEKDHWCDDIHFFNKVREAGFKIHCDLNSPVGHIASAVVWPRYVDGKWMTVYNTNGVGEIMFPAIRPEVNNGVS